MTQPSVQRQSLTEQIQTILLERIMNGTLRPGDRLKELQIAQEFGTSQAPVREALRSLKALGYVEHKPHYGALVKQFSVQEIKEASQIRQAMEGHCLLVLKASTKLIKQLRDQLVAMQEAVQKNDVKLFTRADNRFHRAIIEHAQNRQMLEIWDSLGMQLQVIATLTETAVPLESVYELHPPIVEALEQQHREESIRLLANHYQQTGKYWEKHGHPM